MINQAQPNSKLVRYVYMYVCINLWMSVVVIPKYWGLAIDASLLSNLQIESKQILSELALMSIENLSKFLSIDGMFYFMNSKY